MPPVAAKGFRPFFLLAGSFAALILPVWLLTVAGLIGPTGYLDAMTWHAHEMVFGFAVAVFAGFLLTAVSNWTGRETLVGAPLLAACGLWALGRVAMALAASLPPGIAALVDLAFLPMIVVAIGRPLVASRSRRNFVMLAALAVIWAADVVIHLDALGALRGATHRAVILAIDVVVLLMVVITGRVVPMFTKSATGATEIRAIPLLDKLAIGGMVVTTVLDATTSDSPRFAGAASLATALLVAARSATWGSRHIARLPMLWILHAGHAWIVVGLALRGAAAFTPAISPVLATHALTVGAVGGLTLGMMSRVSLGHTGRLLNSSPVTTLSFVLVTLAALVRVVGPLVDMAAYRATVFLSGGLWTAAFASFVVVHAGVLVRPRIDGKAG